MSRYFKLIDAIDSPQTINVARRKNGVVNYGYVELFPGKKYELADDDIFVKSLKGATVTKRHSSELVAMLKEYGIPYTEKYCSSCGGRVKKISYCVVEVVE